MKRIAAILVIIALVAAYHTGGVLWGRNGKLYALIAMLALYVVLALVLFVLRRKLRREQPELAATLELEAGAPWYWKLLDGGLGVSFAFTPPLVVSLMRHQPLSWESEFTGYHLLALAGGVGLYFLGRACVVRQWQRRQGLADDDV